MQGRGLAMASRRVVSSEYFHSKGEYPDDRNGSPTEVYWRHRSAVHGPGTGLESMEAGVCERGRPETSPTDDRSSRPSGLARGDRTRQGAVRSLRVQPRGELLRSRPRWLLAP